MDATECVPPMRPVTASVAVSPWPWGKQPWADLRAVTLSRVGTQVEAWLDEVCTGGSRPCPPARRVRITLSDSHRGLSRDAAREVARYLTYFADHGRLPDGPLM